MDENKPIYDADGNFIRRYTQNSQNDQKKKSAKQGREGRKLYRTFVEKWKPGSDKIFCPKCNTNVRLIIRTSANRVSHSPIGAALIMTCWPFCFFPLLFPAPHQEDLHCSICAHYFGSYDHQKQTMHIPKQSVREKTEISTNRNISKQLLVPEKMENINTDPTLENLQNLDTAMIINNSESIRKDAASEKEKSSEKARNAAPATSTVNVDSGNKKAKSS